MAQLPQSLLDEIGRLPCAERGVPHVGPGCLIQLNLFGLVRKEEPEVAVDVDARRLGQKAALAWREVQQDELTGGETGVLTVERHHTDLDVGQLRHLQQMS